MPVHLLKVGAGTGLATHRHRGPTGKRSSAGMRYAPGAFLGARPSAWRLVWVAAKAHYTAYPCHTNGLAVTAEHAAFGVIANFRFKLRAVLPSSCTLPVAGHLQMRTRPRRNRATIAKSCGDVREWRRGT